MAEAITFEGRSYSEKLSKDTYPVNMGSLDMLSAFQAFEQKWAGEEAASAAHDRGMLREMEDVLRAGLSEEDAGELLGTRDIRIIEDAYVQVAAMYRDGQGWRDFADAVGRYLPGAAE